MKDNNKKLVLIVDDQSKNLQLLANILYNNNYEVAMASNGMEALQILDISKPELILLDIMMPEMDGFDVMQKIQQDETINDIPVIFLTANSDDETILKSFKAGAADYITKPFNAGELLARANTHIELYNKRKELMEINLKLDEKVKQRTEELNNANIRLAKLDEAKSNFISLLSHELRTPINGIKGFASVLKKELENEEFIEYTNHIIYSTEKLQKFTELSLLITGLKSEHYTISPDENDIVMLLKESIFNLNENIIEKNINIIEQYEKSEYIIKADANLISQSLKLIIENAIKYNTEGGNITAKIFDDDKYVYIEILNDGKVFPDSILESNMDMFSSNNILHHSEGTGLGLATVKTVMHYHSGELLIKNEGEQAVATLIFNK
jgi:two-component system sensor histidine kinase/response regulator